jgi:cephalosporin hydroxylase
MSILNINLNDETVTVDSGAGPQTYALASDEAFSAITKVWLRCGWDKKYTYGFSWFGRPVIQLPEDIVRMQELVYSIQPDVIVETGVAHGGSLVFYASLMKAMGKGAVIGVDVEIRKHNRTAIESHPLSPLITLIEGSSVDPLIVSKVQSAVAGKKCLVVLDSNHTKSHVLAELDAYAPLVPVGSYIVAMDGIMSELEGAPRSKPGWSRDNPKVATEEFVARNKSFRIVEPEFPFNEGTVKQRVTYCPGAFVVRIS